MHNSTNSSVSTDRGRDAFARRREAGAKEGPYDPGPWAVLEEIEAIPLPSNVKAALRRSHDSRCRRYLFPLVRILAVVIIAIGVTIRMLLPAAARSYRGLHACVLGGLQLFALPETKLLILRHFNIGSRILDFLVANADRREIPNEPQYPKSLWELWPNGFMDHDLNLYRVLEGLATRDSAGPRSAPAKPIDFSPIVAIDLEAEWLGPRRWWQFLDLHSAIELIVPLYVIFLPLRETFRASHSLQLDEVVALHLVGLVGEGSGLAFVGNRNPWVPLSLLGTGARLLAHGVSTEIAYEMLSRLKVESEASLMIRSAERASANPPNSGRVAPAMA